MKRTAFLLLATIWLGSFAIVQAGAPRQGDKLRAPAKGSAERKAIMDGLRENYKTGPSAEVVFKVNYIKAHNGWAWVDATPMDKKGKAIAEGGPSLLHYEQGAWKVMELPELPEDPNDPMPAEDASPRFIKAAQKKYAGLPSDIFPKRQK